jgi:hypothetical protein
MVRSAAESLENNIDKVSAAILVLASVPFGTKAT